jgi:NTE family protein
MLKSVNIEDLRKEGFSLILSGGSALGIAHIGVIKWLEENNLVPKEVIGTSMGSVIGSLYSTGYSSKEILKLVKLMSGVNLFKLNLTQGKMKIITTEINSGKPYVFDSNSKNLISDVVRASIAIPGIFDAKKIGKHFYIDGGISSNLGVEYAPENMIKIASNVVNYSLKIKYNEPKGFFSGLKERFLILDESMHYLIRNQTYPKANYIKKLLLIEPDMAGFSTYKINKYKKMIKKGYEEAKRRII